MKVLNIGIVGAGVGGLTCALILKSYGHKVSIFEKSPESLSSGVGIQLSSNAVRILRKFGLEEDIIKISNFPSKIDCINGHNGKIITSIPLGKFAEKKFKAGFYQLHRNELISVLKNKIDKIGIKINFNKQVYDLKQNSSSAILKLEKTYLHFDFIIGADGINSLTRQKFFYNNSPHFLNQVAYRTLIETNKLPERFSENKTLLLFGSGKHAVSYPIKKFSYTNFVFCIDSQGFQLDDWNKKVNPQELINNFSDFQMLQDVFDKITLVKKWGLFDYPILKKWYKNRIILVGDACHPILPYLAQGASQAIEDSFVLCQYMNDNCFKNNPSFFLEKYSKKRFKRILKIKKASKKNAILYHIKNPILKFLFHFSLRTGGYFPNFLLQRFAWIYKGGPA